MSYLRNLMMFNQPMHFAAPNDQGAAQSEPATRPVYSPEEFIEFGIGDMRVKFPKETAGYDDVTLFNVCMMPDDDLSDTDWSELLLKHQPEQEKSEDESEEISTQAQRFASRVSADTEAALDKAADGKEDWQGGPITVRAGLLRDFTKEEEGKVICELDQWPVPGSKDGNNPDRYKAQVTNKATGETSLKPTSFYLQFTRGTPKGQAIETEIAYLRRAGNLEAIKTDIPESILALKDGPRKTRIAYLENRVKNMAAAYKKAMALHHQAIAFNELICKVDKEGKVNADPSLNVRFKQGSVRWAFKMVTDEEGDDTDEVNTKLQAPITIWAHPGYEAGTGEPRPIKEQKDVSVGAFLKFKCGVAMKNGSTFKALLKTVERAPKTTKTKTADTKTETVDQYVARFVEGHRFMSEMQQATDPKDLTKLYDVLKADARDKTGGELVSAFVGYRNWLDDIISELQLNAAYTEIQKRMKKIADAA